MVCCEYCFKDFEIKSIIRNDNVLGKCDLCGKTDVYIYDTDNPTELVDSMEGFFDIYTAEEDLEEGFLPTSLLLLKDELKNNWDIFADNLTPFMIETLIRNICPEYFVRRSSLLTSQVCISKLSDLEYLDANSIVGRHSWDDFVFSIKNKYRFHTNIFKKDTFKEYLGFLGRGLKAGEVFYRARISSGNGFEINKMGAPSKDIVSAGRVNPQGMSYLYLSDSPETTIYETRASLHDYVCIGKFKLLDDIKVIDLTGLDKISVFIPDLNSSFHAINRGPLKRINEEIARPMRSGDSHLDYLPTQYICDLIKSVRDVNNSERQAYQGIMYKSTMINESYNIAIFEEELLECVETEIREVAQVIYKY